jgi:thiol-disulfide isomerase/thioredoxin
MRTLAAAIVLALGAGGCERAERGGEGAGGRAPAAIAEARAARVEPSQEPVGESADWIDVDADSLALRLAARPEPYLLVNVWSTWCAPCVEEMPGVIRTARRYEDRGLGLVFIAADAPSNRDAARALLEERGASLPSFFKRGPDDAFIRALHPEWTGALPATLLFDRERRVRRFWSEPVDEAALRGPIEELLVSSEDP